MQGFRKYVAVVSLGTAVVLGSAVNSPPTAPHRHGRLDESVIAQVLSFFGIELQSRLSTPPG